MTSDRQKKPQTMGEVLAAFGDALGDQRRRGLPRMSVEQVRRIQEIVKVSSEPSPRPSPVTDVRPVAAVAKSVEAQVRDAAATPAPSPRSEAAAQNAPVQPKDFPEPAAKQPDTSRAPAAAKPTEKPAPIEVSPDVMPWIIDESPEAEAERQAAKAKEKTAAERAEAEAAAARAAEAQRAHVAPPLAPQFDEQPPYEEPPYEELASYDREAMHESYESQERPRAAKAAPAPQAAARAPQAAARAPQAAARAAQPTAPAARAPKAQSAPPTSEVQVAALQNVPDRGAKTRTMADIRASLGDCTRCALSQSRTNLVFGEGDPDARLMLIGEAPSRLDDARGRLFSDDAGELLTAMLKAMGLGREQVYTTSILKCRPPNNRAGEREELMACARFLRPQIETVQPEVILTLGSEASRLLLGSSFEFSSRRGEWGAWEGIPVMPTWHPGYLIHHPAEKRSAWADLQQVMERLGLRR